MLPNLVASLRTNKPFCQLMSVEKFAIQMRIDPRNYICIIFCVCFTYFGSLLLFNLIDCLGCLVRIRALGGVPLLKRMVTLAM